MFKAVLGGIVGILLAIMAMTQFEFNEQDSDSVEFLYQNQVTQFIEKRYGVKNIDVIAYVSMQPSQNAMVIERLSPQKIVSKKTIIGSENAELPLPNTQPKRLKRPSASSFSLPGMSNLIDPEPEPESDSDYSPSSNLVTVTNEKKEGREQQLIEHVFYNKETQSISYTPQISSLRLAVFMPDLFITDEVYAEIYSELNQVLNFDNQFSFFLLLKPIQTPLAIQQFYDAYDSVLIWIKKNPVLIGLVFFGLVLLGSLIQYIRFRMALRLTQNDKTIVIKDSSHDALPDKVKAPNPVLLNATPKELVSYFTKGVTVE